MGVAEGVCPVEDGGTMGEAPRPAAAVPRRSGFVTPRPLSPRGKGGGIGAGASVEPAAWPPGRLRPGG